jgi:histidine triad (HIT) family protein
MPALAGDAVVSASCTRPFLHKNLMVKKNQIIILITVALVGLCGYFLLKNREKAQMMSPDCIFCKIITHQIPAAIIAENGDVIVIKDIHPKAPTHLLIIPKKHIQDIQNLAAADLSLSQSMIAMAQELSKANNNQDFRLVVNSGKNAGQKVFHLHMHYLAGEIQHDDV